MSENRPQQTTDTWSSKKYDVIIVGAGVCGAALSFVLRKYTNVGRIAVLERKGDAGAVNSAKYNNSQTLHFGDIETNYDIERSRSVKQAAERLRRYLDQHDPDGHMHSIYSKMVLAVGAEETKQLAKRYEQYRDLYPNLRKLDRDGISTYEPKILEGRDPQEPILALQTDQGYAVDFGALCRSFLNQARTEDGVDVRFGTRVDQLERTKNGFIVHTQHGPMRTRTVAVMAGAFSMGLATQIGERGNRALLNVAGSFFTTPAVLNGKVYTMQIEQLPFAAVHGDPDVDDPTVTRFGPTAKALPLLERHDYSTLKDYLRTAGLRMSAFAALLHILFRPPIFRFVLMNMLYDIPGLGRLLFARKARRIVPNLRARDLRRAKGFGGIRPQVVNVANRKLNMGEQKIRTPGAIFNITPSPGASVCLASAEEDAAELVRYLGAGYHFDREAMERDYGESPEEESAPRSGAQATYQRTRVSHV